MKDKLEQFSIGVLAIFIIGWYITMYCPYKWLHERLFPVKATHVLRKV